METVRIHLAKQTFKFSAAHFMIFDAKRAERMHGHNYSVRLRLEISCVEEKGFVRDFNDLKKVIHSVLAELDEYVIFPALNTEIQSKVTGAEVEIRFRNRRYVLPRNEVLLLPISNTSVEEFSRYLATRFSETLKDKVFRSLEVYVEESPGQGAAYQLQFVQHELESERRAPGSRKSAKLRPKE